MRLSPARFNRHLANMGQRVLWRQAHACACVSPTSGQPDPKHALCSGKGWIWSAPVETVVGVSNQNINPEMIAAGIYDKGDMTLTVPESSPVYEAGRFDRLILLNSTDVFSQPFQRGAVTERVLFTPASITRCFWLDPVTRDIVEGDLPVIGTDGRPSWARPSVFDGQYLFDGSLTWDGLAPVREPPLGATYSLTGTRYDEYYIFDHLPSDRNMHSGARLPKRVQLRKWDLFGR